MTEYCVFLKSEGCCYVVNIRAVALKYSNKFDIISLACGISELSLEDILNGGKPHSFGELKFPSSQTALFSCCRIEIFK